MINKIKAKLKSDTSKSLMSNFMYLSILQIVGFVLPLITLPYLARVIGVEKFGIIAFASAIMAYFIAFVDFGFNYTATRDIAKCRENRLEVSRIFCTVMFARIILLIISFIILFFLIQIIPIFKENSTIIYYTFLMVPGYLMLPEWFFQAMEQMKFITLLSLLVKLIFTILIFTVVKEEADYIYQPLLLSTGFIISGIIALIIIFKRFKITLIIPSLTNIWIAIKSSYNMFICIIFPNLYSNITTIFLTQFSGSIAVGIFDSGNKFVNFSERISSIISRVFYPFLARHIDKHNTYNYIMMIVSIFMSLCLFFGAELIVNIFYTAAFTDAIFVIKLMAVTPILLYLNNAFGTNYLVLIKKEKILQNIIITCSLLGFGVSYLMVTRYGYIGACLTLIIVRGAMGLITYIYARKYRLKLNIKK